LRPSAVTQNGRRWTCPFGDGLTCRLLRCLHMGAAAIGYGGGAQDPSLRIPHRICWSQWRNPHERELKGAFCNGVPATARVARGQAPRLHICAICLERCVVDGFTPSRPLRSPGTTPQNVPLSSRQWRTPCPYEIRVPGKRKRSQFSTLNSPAHIETSLRP
jgi:hypothetical protein